MPRPTKNPPAQRGPGRPPVDGETRSAMLMFRALPSERDELYAAAARESLRFADWIRSLALREARRPR